MPPAAVRFDTLLAYALQHRADLQSAHTAVEVSTSNIKLQRSMAWPQPELGVIWNPQNTIRYAGFFGTIELPLFSRNQGEIQRSTILRQQAEQSITAIEAQITTEITTAYNSFVTQQHNVQRFADILMQSQTILDNVRYAYLRGGTTIIDFLEAQQSWLDTQQQYFDAQQQYQQSYIELLFVSGQINALAQ
jgi:cobalt-zinc-cadmium efflux system outer membrane protein